MWGGNNYPVEAKSCREDLEMVAARLKKQINIKSALRVPLEKYVENFSYDFDGSERKTLFAIVGGLAIEIPKLEAEYQALLAKIETGER